MINGLISIIIEKRTEDAPTVQQILTKYGCLIKVRLGIHELEGCTNKGLIILVVHGSENEINKLINELNSQPQVTTNLNKIE